MKRFILAVVLLSLICAAPKPPKPDAPAAAVMATTDDGRRVILLPNGSWQFVEGAAPAAPKPAPTACRDAEFDELVNYFSGWPLDRVDKGGFLIVTKWMSGDTGKSNVVGLLLGGGEDYQISLSVVVNPDCTLTVKRSLRTMGEHGSSSWIDSHLDDMVFKPTIPGMNGDAVAFYTWYRNLYLDLAAIQKKHAPSAPDLVVPPPPPAASGSTTPTPPARG